MCVRCVRCVSASGIRDPPFLALVAPLAAVPAGALHGCGDAALLCCAELRCLEPERIAGDLTDRDLWLVPRGDRFEVLADMLFPGIGLEACFLFRRDMLSLEIGVGPPARAAAIKPQRFGKELVPVAGEIGNLDGPDLDRPKPAPAG